MVKKTNRRTCGAKGMINTKVCPKCEGTGVVIAYHSNCTVGARHAYTLPSGKRTNKCILCGIKKS